MFKFLIFIFILIVYIYSEVYEVPIQYQFCNKNVPLPYGKMYELNPGSELDFGFTYIGYLPKSLLRQVSIDIIPLGKQENVTIYVKKKVIKNIKKFSKYNKAERSLIYLKYKVTKENYDFKTTVKNPDDITHPYCEFGKCGLTIENPTYESIFTFIITPTNDQKVNFGIRIRAGDYPNSNCIGFENGGIVVISSFALLLVLSCCTILSCTLLSGYVGKKVSDRKRSDTQNAEGYEDVP